MKAWRVFTKEQSIDQWSSCVFAETIGKAKKTWFDEWAYECEATWTDIIAHREKEFDGCYDKPKIFDGASDLKEIKSFWRTC